MRKMRRKRRATAGWPRCLRGENTTSFHNEWRYFWSEQRVCAVCVCEMSFLSLQGLIRTLCTLQDALTKNDRHAQKLQHIHKHQTLSHTHTLSPSVQRGPHLCSCSGGCVCFRAQQEINKQELHLLKNLTEAVQMSEKEGLRVCVLRLVHTPRCPCPLWEGWVVSVWGGWTGRDFLLVSHFADR